MADISHISIPSFNIDGDINDTIARTTINNHVADKNNPHNVTKAQIGLGNVDNTSDMDKPISTAVQNALDKKANNTLATESLPGLMSAEDKKAVDREFFKLVPRGATYVPHGADLSDNQYFKVGTYYHDQKPSEKPEERGIIHGIPGDELHESPLAGMPFTMYVMAPYSDKYDDESTADEMTLERLRIMVVEGSIYTQGAFNRYKVVEGEGDWFTDYWTAIATDVDIRVLKQYIDEHIYSKSNPHGVTKDQVGLDNVDNTADKDKSVNHAESAGYADAADFANHSGYADSANHVSWGNVSGKPSTYPPDTHTHTKDQVGLDNVDNTADKDKSVKYAESAGSANSVAWDNVTGKPTTMASSVAWDDITDKPSTYPPSSHTHTPDEVGLGNVANLDQSKAIKSITRSGTTFTATALDGTTTTFTQQDADTTSVTWDDITDKPSTYPPSSHTHTPDEVGLGNVDNTADKDKSVKYATTAGTANSITWKNVSDKPSTYPPDAHTHTPDEVGLGNVDNTADKDKSVKYATSAGSANAVAWDNVSDKPSTYPPDAHTHTPSEVGLGNVDNTADKDKPISTAVQNALDGKANISVATSSTDGLMSKSDKAKLDSIEAGSNVESVNGKTGAVTLNKADIGLGNVDNTADKDKSVKYATSAGSANAVAWDNVTGKPSTYPPSSHTHTSAEVGLGNVDNTADKDKSVKYATTAGTANSVAWDDITNKPSTIDSSVTWDDITDKPSTYTPSSHTHTPSEVGLGNVDNTADKDKPISTAVQNALDNKVTKNNTADTNGLLNSLNTEETTPTDADYYISQHAGGGTTTTTYHRRPMSALWAFIKSKCDSIYATVSALNTHISNKSNPHGVTKAQVGLSNVDNTSDANKPISTAVQQALNAKANNSVATESTDGLMSAADKLKLDGIGVGSNVKSVNGKTGVVAINKSDVGLGNVDNTSDANKPISTAVQQALNAKANNSVATKSSNGLMSAADKNAVDREFFKLVPRGGTYIPPNADLNTMQYIKIGIYYNSSGAETQTMKNCPAGVFIMYVLSPIRETYDDESTLTWVYRLRIFVEYAGNIFTQLVFSDNTAGSFNYGPWVKMTNSNDLGAVSNVINTHISNKSNPHGVTKAQVGLGNVDNTADSAKSVKYAESAGSVAWNDVTDKPSTYPPDAHTHSYLPLSGGTVTGALAVNGKLTATGRLIAPTNGGFWIYGKDVTNAVLGISTQAGYDGSRWDPIIAQMDYAGGTWNMGSLGNQVGFAGFYKNRIENAADWYHYIQTTDGTVHFGATVYANVSGSLSGNASTATRATQDSSGQQIDSTYIKSLSVSGRTITYTRGNGTTGTITTQDTNTTYDILNSVYPVGSIYMSMKPTSPASFIGGTWLPITNEFLFASGSVYAAGETGGEYSHTLTMAELPNHAHAIHGVNAGISPIGGGTDHTFSVSYASLNEWSSTVGGDMPHNNMPPYLVVYMWRRTA
jgi:hypothetical protein